MTEVCDCCGKEVPEDAVKYVWICSKCFTRLMERRKALRVSKND